MLKPLFFTFYLYSSFSSFKEFLHTYIGEKTVGLMVSPGLGTNLLYVPRGQKNDSFKFIIAYITHSN